MYLPISSIRVDGGTQPRATINLQTVSDYMNDMASGAEFPPVDVFYDGSSYWLADGFLEFGTDSEECVEVLAVDPEAQTFDAVVTKDHPACSIRPCIWPTPILHEGNDLTFDIKAVASPNPGSDLTVVIQT